MMNSNDKARAVELVNDMVAHGYHLMQYKDAEDMVNYYSLCNLKWWQDIHDRFLKTVA